MFKGEIRDDPPDLRRGGRGHRQRVLIHARLFRSPALSELSESLKLHLKALAVPGRANVAHFMEQYLARCFPGQVSSEANCSCGGITLTAPAGTPRVDAAHPILRQASPKEPLIQLLK